MLNDAMFKSVIRSKEARPIVNNFLHFLTNIQMEKLETAIYMGGEITKSHMDEKGKISDVIIKIENCKIILEMNQTDTKAVSYTHLENAKLKVFSCFLFNRYDKLKTAFM